jgi:HAD superfamily hydrolase (TIGR01509 family)
MGKIKAVIFDMDGVLVDAKEWHYEALNKALSYFGMAISRFEHVVSYDGFPTKKKLEMLTIEKNLPKGLHPFLCKLKQQYTLDEITVKCKPQFIHQYALSRLKSEGYKLAVCSNSVKETIALMLEKADLIQYLNFFLSNEDVQHCKPHPEMYLKSFERFSLKPQECLIIEDNMQGLKAAKDSQGHWLEVKDTTDVTYDNIMNRIKEIEGGKQ